MKEVGQDQGEITGAATGAGQPGPREQVQRGQRRKYLRDRDGERAPDNHAVTPTGEDYRDAPGYVEKSSLEEGQASILVLCPYKLKKLHS